MQKNYFLQSEYTQCFKLIVLRLGTGVPYAISYECIMQIGAIAKGLVLLIFVDNGEEYLLYIF
jgi:hypothetical protein